MDHADTIVRHLMDIHDAEAALARGDYAAPEHDGLLKQLKDDLDALVWRAALLSQEAHEKYFGAPLAPAARLPQPPEPSQELKRRLYAACAEGARGGAHVCTCGPADICDACRVEANS
jgi:hypothetical protein